MSLKYGISKFLKDRCGIDIKTDAEFLSCQSIFKAKVVDLKKKGKGSTEHKLEISPEDLQKLTMLCSILQLHTVFRKKYGLT